MHVDASDRIGVGVAHEEPALPIVRAPGDHVAIGLGQHPKRYRRLDIVGILAQLSDELGGRDDGRGEVIALDVKAGDTILVGKYAGPEVSIDGEDYVILREDEVLAVIE